VYVPLILASTIRGQAAFPGLTREVDHGIDLGAGIDHLRQVGDGGFHHLL